MAISSAEIKAVLTLQDQMSAQLKTISGEVTKLGASAKNAGPGFVSMAGAVAAGTAALNLSMAAIKGVTGMLMGAAGSATEFGQTMANVRALIPDAEFAQFGGEIEKLALRLGKDYPLSAAEAGNAIEMLIKKGISVKDVMGGAAEAVVQLSSATGADLVTSAELTAQAMDAFGLSTEQLPSVIQAVAAAQVNAGVSATDFGFALKASAAVIKLAGGTIEDFTIGVSAMAKAGIDGSDAGTSLKTMYSNLIPHSKSATAAMKELGLITKDGANQFFDATGKAKSYEEISRLLAAATADMSEKQKLAAFNTIFGSDAIRAASVAATYGTGAFGALGEKLKQVDPGEIAKKRMDSLAGSLKQFTGSAETIGIVLLGKMGPAMKTVVDIGTALLNKVLERLDSTGATAFFNSLAGAVQKMGQQAFAVSEYFDLLVDSLDGIPVVGGLVKSVLAGLADAFAIIGTLINGDVEMSVLNAENMFKKFGDAIGYGADLVNEFIDTIGGPAFIEVWSFILDEVGVFVDWFTENLPLIQETAETVFNAIKDTVIYVWPIIKNTIDAALKIILAVVKMTMQVINGDWEGAWETLKDIAAKAWDAIVVIVKAAWPYLEAALSAIWAGIKAGATIAWEALKAYLSETWESIKATISEALTAVSTAINTKWGEIKASVASLVDQVMAVILAPWHALPADIRADLILIAGALVEKWGEIKDKAAEHWEAIKSTISTAWTNITTAIGNALAPVVAAVAAVWTTVRDAVGGWWDTIKGAIVGAMGGIIGPVQSSAYSVGQAIIDGIAKAIRNGIDYVSDLAASVARKALAAAKEALGLPSSGGNVPDAPSTPDIPEPTRPDNPPAPDDLPGFASGGFLAAGRLALVGERGPELFMSAASGTILPADYTARALGGGSIVINVNAPVYGVRDMEDVIVGALASAGRRGRVNTTVLGRTS